MNGPSEPAASPQSSGFPPPHELTSHQAPALLVAELLAAETDGSGGRTRLTNATGLDLLQLAEGCAQSLAVIMGLASRLQGGEPASGMLVGVKDAVLTRAPAAGEEIEVSAVIEARLPPFRLYRCQVCDSAGHELFRAALKTVSEEERP